MWLLMAFLGSALACESVSLLETRSVRAWPIRYTAQLHSQNTYGIFTTNAQIEFELSAKGIDLEVLHYQPPGTVGSAYNVYGIEIYVDEQKVFSADWSNQCRDPGVSLFPGQSIRVREPLLRPIDCSHGCRVTTSVRGAI